MQTMDFLQDAAAGMTQDQRLDFLLGYLLKEQPAYHDTQIPTQSGQKRQLLRALMNVRPPQPIGQDFLDVQDQYLQTARDERGIVDGAALPPLARDPRLALWQGDITTLRADAIVNAANSALLGCFHPLHGCIDNLIHTRSGVQLRLLCNDLMQAQGHPEPAGRAKLTPAFNLPSRYILHTVGPIVRGRLRERERDTLAACYRACLELAVQNGCQTLAFCCISTGEFHFPNEAAAEIAVQTVSAFLHAHRPALRVIFNVFKDQDLHIYQSLLGKSKC